MTSFSVIQIDCDKAFDSIIHLLLIIVTVFGLVIWSDNTSDDDNNDFDDVDDVDDDDDALNERLVKYKERLPQWVISVIAGLRFAQGAH